VSVVLVNPTGVVVPEDLGEADGGLSGGVVSRVELGDCCVFVRAWIVVHGLSLALAMRINCSWFEAESHCPFCGSWMVCAVASQVFSAVCPVWW
jgi:hypothetical protein